MGVIQIFTKGNTWAAGCSPAAIASKPRCPRGRPVPRLAETDGRRHTNFVVHGLRYLCGGLPRARDHGSVRRWCAPVSGAFRSPAETWVEAGSGEDRGSRVQ